MFDDIGHGILEEFAERSGGLYVDYSVFKYGFTISDFADHKESWNEASRRWKACNKKAVSERNKAYFQAKKAEIYKRRKKLKAKRQAEKARAGKTMTYLDSLEKARARGEVAA